MNRSDATSRGSSSAVGVEFNAVPFRLCSVCQLMKRVSRADAWIDNTDSSGREVQQFPQALAFLRRQRVVAQLDPSNVAPVYLQNEKAASLERAGIGFLS